MRHVTITLLFLCACGERAADQFAPLAAYPVLKARPTSVEVAPRPGETRGVYELVAPPPISGGTLLVTSTGKLVAGDPDYDTLWIYDGPGIGTSRVQLQLGDEVGRMAEDVEGHVHVVLRRAGAIATLDVSTAKVISRRAVCDEPRGITYEPATYSMLVSCAGGELVALPLAGGAAQMRQHFADDLRDVFIDEGDIVVSRFRKPELIRASASGTETRAELATQPLFADGVGHPFVPSVAWRSLPLGSRRTLVAHQRGTIEPINLRILPRDAGFGSDAGVIGLDGGLVVPGGPYGAGGPELPTQQPCALPSGILQSVVSIVTADGASQSLALPGALPVDVAVNPSTGFVVVAMAGSHSVVTTSLASISALQCSSMNATQLVAVPFVALPGQPTSVAVTANGFAVLLRNPPRLALSVNGTSATRLVPLPVPTFRDPDLGQELFHRQTPSGLACASCHPDGREDGRVWSFAPGGARRTQTLAIGLSRTAPFHWDGTMGNMNKLLSDVLVERMGAVPPSEGERVGLVRWMDSIPRPARRFDNKGNLGHGQQLFNDPLLGCSTCHSGGALTNNLNANVGTGEALQVPSLIGVGARAPYMHDGCAPTLEARFSACGGAMHGDTSRLSAGDLVDLVSYLKTL